LQATGVVLDASLWLVKEAEISLLCSFFEEKSAVFT
jgi:hypothetical protein